MAVSWWSCDCHVTMTVACHYVVGCQGPVATDAEEDDMVTMATSGSSAVRLTAFLKRASQVRGQRRRREREIRGTGRETALPPMSVSR